MEFTGTVKSFNPNKGWGMIECSKTHKLYGKDMFVLKTAFPTGSASIGMKVKFSVGQGNQGPEAQNIKVLGGGAAMTPMTMAPQAGGQCSGIIKSFNPAKGWGFITSPQVQAMLGKDIFFMKTAVSMGMVPAAGMQVSFFVGQGANGPQAEGIQLVGGPTGGMTGSIGSPMMPKGADQLFVGIVKGYNEEKGWGHITCDAAKMAYGKEVFMMKSSLSGEVPVPGQLVVFKVTMATKGPQATEVKILPPRYIDFGGEPGQRHSGVVKSFNAQKGFGFITNDELQQMFCGKDVFFLKTQLPEGSSPAAGEAADFAIEVGTTGRLQAKDINFGGVEAYAPQRSLRPAASRAKPF